MLTTILLVLVVVSLMHLVTGVCLALIVGAHNQSMEDIQKTHEILAALETKYGGLISGIADKIATLGKRNNEIATVLNSKLQDIARESASIRGLMLETTGVPIEEGKDNFAVIRRDIEQLQCTVLQLGQHVGVQWRFEEELPDITVGSADESPTTSETTEEASQNP